MAKPDDRVAGWRRDIDHLIAEARRVHAGPARPAHGRLFGDAAATLARRIPELSDRRIAVEIQRLMAILGDGHSVLYATPSRRVAFGMLPVELYLFDDGLFIVDGTGGSAPLIGAQVVRFGARPTADVVGDMTPFVSRDNAMGVKAFASLYLVIPTFLEAWGASLDADRMVLTVVDRAGATRVITLTTGPARRTRRRLLAPTGAAGPVPIYLQEPGRAYWTRALTDRGAMYVAFNQVMNAPEEPLAAFSTRLRNELASTRARHLIVDVRHNNGGNNTLLEPLLATIADFAAGGRGRRVYVVTSRVTFSAAQNFITRLERRVPTAIFAGEPSMSSPNFTGEDHAVPLPFSGLTVSISNRHWQDSDPDDRRPWIAPHLPVPLTSADWLANRDPVLDAVLRDITRQAGPVRFSPR
jgi:hypothetical protein